MNSITVLFHKKLVLDKYTQKGCSEIPALSLVGSFFFLRFDFVDQTGHRYILNKSMRILPPTVIDIDQRSRMPFNSLSSTKSPLRRSAVEIERYMTLEELRSSPPQLQLFHRGSTDLSIPELGNPY